MIEKFAGHAPAINGTAFIHPSAVITGKVKIGINASIWPLAVLRGDVDRIEIGEGTNVQDLCVLHGRPGVPTLLGKNVTVGHSVVLHGCVIGSNCLIGMKSVVMESEVGKNSIIAAGCIIPKGRKIPPGSLVMGIPGKVARKLSREEIRGIARSAKEYIRLAKKCKTERGT